MASLLLLLIVLDSLVLCRSTDSDLPLVHKNNCTNATDFENVIQISNVESLLQTLITVNIRVGSHNDTAGNPPDTFYGHFLCRGDVSGHAWQICIKKAKMEITEECTGKKEAILWFDNCLLRFSNWSFFSVMGSMPPVSDDKRVTFPDNFRTVLGEVLQNVTNTMM